MDYGYDSSDSEDCEVRPYEESSAVLVTIDCSESMFVPSETLNGLTGLQTALRALDNVYNDLILTKITKNKIAVTFFHPDHHNKMVLIDFDSPLIDLIKKLKKLAYSPSDKLDVYRKADSKLSMCFSDFLHKCREKFRAINKSDLKSMLYVSNCADPCEGNKHVKFRALQAVKDFMEMGISFKLVPLVEEFDYSPFFGEAYAYIGEAEPKHYYNLDFLTTLIRGTVRFRLLHTNIELHLSTSSDSEQFISCLQRKYTEDAKLLTNKTMTRDLQMEAHKTTERAEEEEMYRILISQDVYAKDLNKEQKEDLHKTPQIKKGLTIIHASTKRYSRLGENFKGSRVIRAKDWEDSEFIALWEACVKDKLNLLCYLKYKETGKVHSAELVPKMLNFQRNFLVVIIPHALDLFAPTLPSENITYDKDLCSIFDDLVDRSTIKDYDLRKIKPYVYTRQVKYFKQELLGSDYVDTDDINDLVHDQQYEGDVTSLTRKLNLLFPADSKGGKRQKNQAGGVKRRKL